MGFGALFSFGVAVLFKQIREYPQTIQKIDRTISEIKRKLTDTQMAERIYTVLDQRKSHLLHDEGYTNCWIDDGHIYMAKRTSYRG